MSFFDGLDAEKYDRKYTDRALFQRIFAYFRPHWKRMLIILISTLLIGGISAVQPILISRTVDKMDVHAAGGSIFLIAGAIGLLGLAIWVINWYSRRITVRTIADVVLKLATDAFTAANAHDLSFYDEFSSGKVVSRITSDTRDFGQLVTIVTEVVSQVIEAIILMVVLFSIEARLTLYLFVLPPIVLLLTYLYRTLARNATRHGMRAMANVNATIKETISGIAVAKNFRQENAVYTLFDDANRQSYRVNVKRGFTLDIVFPTLNALGGMATGAMVYIGGISAAAGAVTVGAWYLFLLSLDRFLYPIMSISSFWTNVQNGLSAAERVFALIDAEPAVVQTGRQDVPALRGEVQFKELSFRYKSGESVLEAFNLHIRAGESLALVGHTGAGKTSVARLIARFYEYQEGGLYIDGHDIRTLDLEQYRRQLGVVSQVPFLFSGSVLENICYARPDVSEEEILVLARQIGDGEWLETLPDGLQTEVGERGARLSMGQRQLVALMRVLVQKPAIFILDEATANIDPFTERQIQQALNLILARTTSVVIAHRLSTVKSADRIIVMKGGAIIEEGSHAQLLEQNGHYASLYNTYFRHQSLAYVDEVRQMMKD